MPTEEEKSVFLKELEKKENSNEQANNNSNSSKNNSNQSENKSTKKKKKKMSATALFASLILLFLLIVALFIFIMSVGGSNNPILKAFGVAEDGAKDFILSLVNGTFAVFGVILLLAFTVGLFVAFSTKKEEKAKRKGSIVFTLISLGLIFLVILVWLGLYSYVNAFVVQASNPNAQIIIEPDPDDNELIAPVDVVLSAEKIRSVLEDYDHEVASWSWNFGSGLFNSPITADTVEYRFQSSGEFEVQVKVTTTEGESETFSRRITIPKARFAAEPLTGNAPLRVEFDATNVSQDLNPEVFEWDFDGDRMPDETTDGPKVTRVFEKIGKYPVYLNVINRDGTVKRFDHEIEVKGESADKMKAEIEVTPELEGNVPFAATFDASESYSIEGEIEKFVWNFGDDTPKEAGKTVEHVYETPGSYLVTLEITDELGSVRETQVEIMAKEPEAVPKAVIKTDPETDNGIIRTTVPTSVTFDASETTDSDDNIVLYEWDFDSDGKVDSKGMLADHVFRAPGEQTATLKVTDNDGNTDSAQIKIIATQEDVVAKINADPAEGSAPLEVTLDGSGSSCNDSDCNISSFRWDFGDDTEASLQGAIVSHRYERIGIYEVKLTVYTNNDKEAVATKKIHVRQIPLTACFNPSRTTGTAPLAVDFDPSCSGGAVSKWEWSFGDGKIASTRRPSHTFYEPGEYEVKLKVFDKNNNIAEISKEVVVK
jgi:PKD repeat protein